MLITGATGFIGRNLVEHYAATPYVLATYPERPQFSHPGVEWVQADLLNVADVEKITQGVDVIVQAAATTSGVGEIFQRPHYHVTSNAIMNSLLFRAAHEAKVKQLVFFSCTIMYASSERPIREADLDLNAEMHPRYFGPGWTKLYLEKMCEFYSRLGHTKFSVLRHSNVYGPHDKYDLARSHVLGATITKVRQAAEGGRVAMWGTGAEKRDFLYVGDLLEAIDALLQKQKEPCFMANVGGGQAYSVKELAEAIVKASGKQVQLEWDHSKPSINVNLPLDCRRMEEATGWRARTPLAKGLQQAYAWASSHPCFLASPPFFRYKRPVIS